MRKFRVSSLFEPNEQSTKKRPILLVLAELSSVGLAGNTNLWHMKVIATLRVRKKWSKISESARSAQEAWRHELVEFKAKMKFLIFPF